MSKVSLDWRICWMQAEVPFKHLKPGETSQLLLSRQMSLPVIGQCSHLRSTGFFWKVTVIAAQLLADAAVDLLSACGCFHCLSDGTECSWHDLGKLLPTQGVSWCEFPHPGVCRCLFMNQILWSTVWGKCVVVNDGSSFRGAPQSCPSAVG